MRPVKANRLPGWASEQLNHRDTQGPRLDVHQRQLNPGDCPGRYAAPAGARGPIHVPETHLIGPGVCTYQKPLEVLNCTGDAVRSPAGALAEPGDALVGLNFDEGPGTPARIHDERLDVHDFHSPPPFGGYHGTNTTTSRTASGPASGLAWRVRRGAGTGCLVPEGSSCLPRNEQVPPWAQGISAIPGSRKHADGNAFFASTRP